jgi:hypothetical protein
MPAWARSRQPRYWAWNAAGLVGNAIDGRADAPLYAGPFGCHPTRPLDHLNGAGLLWRIYGGKITAMQSDWATIEINGGTLSAIAAKKNGPQLSRCQSATRTVRLGGHVQSGTRRVAQKIRGNHSLRKQNPHQRASYWLD